MKYKRISKTVGKALKYMAISLAFLAALGMIAILLLIVTSVVMRQFFNAPLFFSEEMVGLLMSVSLFLALPLVTLQGGHIRVAIFSEYLKNRSIFADRILSSLACVVGIVFCLWLLVEAIPWMAALPLSLSLMGLILFAKLIGWLDNPDESES